MMEIWIDMFVHPRLPDGLVKAAVTAAVVTCKRNGLRWWRWSAYGGGEGVEPHRLLLMVGRVLLHTCEQRAVDNHLLSCCGSTPRNRSAEDCWGCPADNFTDCNDSFSLRMHILLIVGECADLKENDRRM